MYIYRIYVYMYNLVAFALGRRAHRGAIAPARVQ